MKALMIVIAFVLLNFEVAYAQDMILGPSDMGQVLPLVDSSGDELLPPANDNFRRDGRASWYIPKADRGDTEPIPENIIAYLCGDFDGCTVRLGMYDWDNSGRVASRTTLMYYNTTNHVWRGSAGDRSGTDYDGATQHVLPAWACYFTDGEYEKWKPKGDSALNFGLLSWNQYNAACRLTIVD